MLKTVTFVLAVLAAAPTQAGTQAKAALPNSAKLIQLRVTGSQRFPSAVIAAATGLKLGDEVSDGPLKQAADHLAATGMFSDITYRYVSTPQGTKADFQVNDTDKLFPAFFDNFVWLSSSELLKELEKREPLFVGKIPNAGEMSQRVAEDLKNILQKLGVSATVRVYPRMPQDGGELVGFGYAVQGVRIPVVSVDFPGASAEMAPILQKATTASTLLGNNYSETSARSIAALDFLAQYHMRGYLKAVFRDPSAHFQDRALGSVAVQLPVQQGLQYTLAAVQWSGNQVFTLDRLNQAVKDEPGRPLSQVQVEAELGGISRDYRKHGYMDVRLDPKYICDDASQSVTVAIAVNEGAQYHMGAVEFQGLSANATAGVRTLWKLAPGDPFDASYIDLFFTDVSRHFDIRNIKPRYTMVPHRDSKTVDVTIQFSR